MHKKRVKLKVQRIYGAGDVAPVFDCTTGAPLIEVNTRVPLGEFEYSPLPNANVGVSECANAMH